MASRPPSPSHRAEPRILIVDDEEDIRDGLRDALAAALPSARVRTAGSGAEALHLLGDHPADLVLSDYRMPGMDGVTLLRHVHEAHRATRRVLVTAFYGPEVAAAAAAAGVTAVVRKPFDVAELVRLVGRELGLPAR